MRIILIRHGDPDYEHDTLTEKGRREAETLAAQIETLGIDDIYVSSLGRAQDTAAYSLKKLGKEAVATCEWLQEFTAQFDPNLPGAPVEAFAAHEYRKNPETGKYYTRGVWDMLPSYYNQHPELFDKDAWRTSDIAKYSNTVEKYDAVIREFDKLIAKYGYIRDGQCYKCEQGNEKTIALFCHYGITSYFCLTCGMFLLLCRYISWWWLLQQSQKSLQRKEKRESPHSVCYVWEI
jgi:probable phosphoglycerate mutase